MKLIRYITKYDYELFNDHSIGVHMLWGRGCLHPEDLGTLRIGDNPVYQISIEIKETK